MLDNYNRLTRLIYKVRDAILRFPLTSLTVALLYAYTFSRTNGIPKEVLITTLILSPLSLIIAVLSEHKTIKKFHVYITPILLSALLYAYFTQLPWKNQPFDVFVFYLGLFCLFMITPFLWRRDNDKLSFYWNSFANGIVWSLIAAGIFDAGISLAMATINALFADIFSQSAYSEVFKFGFMVLCPLLYLASIPKKDDIEAVHVCTAPRAMKIILSWLLIPLCLLFFGILYAYFIKVVLAGVAPKIILVSFIIAYSLFAVLIYIVSYPLVAEDNQPAKFVQKYIFYILIIPCLILAWRFGVRIAEFGFTLPRFYAVMFTAWLALNIIYHLARLKAGTHDLKFPFLSAALFLFALSLSPVSPGNIMDKGNLTNPFRLFPEQATMQPVQFSFVKDNEWTKITETHRYPYMIKDINLYESSSSRKWDNETFKVTATLKDQNVDVEVCDKACYATTLKLEDLIKTLMKGKDLAVYSRNPQSPRYSSEPLKARIYDFHAGPIALKARITQIIIKYDPVGSKTTLNNVTFELFIRPVQAH